jgi:hypothetical protein
MQPKPKPKSKITLPVEPIKKKKAPLKPPIKVGKDKPYPMPGIDDKVYRTMPITEKQLSSIKKMYGI